VSGEQGWVVHIEGLVDRDLTDDDIENLVDLLAEPVSYRDRRLSTTITIAADDIYPPTAIADAGAELAKALQKIKTRGDVTAIEALTFAEQDRRLALPAFPQLAGISEVAEILGVSRQRASTLQTRAGFPAPVAVLASGPVWRAGDLGTFLETWSRKPGRPAKERQLTAEQIEQRAQVRASKAARSSSVK
jgi:hypothetical protein